LLPDEVLGQHELLGEGTWIKAGRTGIHQHVVTNGMTLIERPAGKAIEILEMGADQKERGWNAMAFQYGKQPVRSFTARAIVDRQSELPGTRRATEHPGRQQGRQQPPDEQRGPGHHQKPKAHDRQA
jgi:hypothetical protein